MSSASHRSHQFRAAELSMLAAASTAWVLGAYFERPVLATIAALAIIVIAVRDSFVARGREDGLHGGR